MAVLVEQSDILAIRAQAAVISLELTMGIHESPANRRLAEACGEELRAAIRALRFLPAGSAHVVEGKGMPFRHVILTVPPRWLTGKANELLVLHRCYESIYAGAEEAEIHSLVMPFLSTAYYRFPKAEAVHIALREAEKNTAETVFVAESQELYALSRQCYRKPAIVAYVGYYRDHAIFELENGQFARVNVHPEKREADVIPYIEACFRAGNNPLQAALPDAEIARLRRIYEEWEY